MTGKFGKIFGALFGAFILSSIAAAGEEARPARAEPAPAGERTVAAAVPADALVFVSAAGRAKWQKALDDSNLGAAYREEEVRKFLAPFIEKAGQFLATGKQQVEANTQGIIKFEEIEKALVGEVGLAFLGLRPKADGAGEAPILLLVAEVGENAQAFEAAMDNFVQRVKQVAPQADLRARAYRGADLRAFSVDKTAIAYARHKGCFLFALDAASVEKAIDCLEGAAASLAANPALKKSENGLLAACVNLAEVIKRERAKNPGKQDWKNLDALGLSAARQLSYRLDFEKPLFHERVALGVDKAEGLLALLKEAKPVDAAKLAADAPGDAAFFMGARLPADKALDAIFKAVESVEPGQADRGRKELLKFKEQGFDLEALLTKSLTGEVALWISMPAAGGLFPEVVISARTRDNAAIEGLVQMLARQAYAGQAFAKAMQDLKAQGGELDGAKLTELARKYRGEYKIEALDYKGGRLFIFPAEQKSPITPCALLLPDRVVFASSPLAAKRAAEPPGAGALSEKADFKANLARLPAGAVAVQYLDMPKIFNLVYGTVAPMLAGRDAEGLKQRFGLDLAQLPPAELVSKHLVPEVGCFYADEQGLRLEARSNAPRAALVSTLAVLLKARATATVREARPVAPPPPPGARPAPAPPPGRKPAAGVEVF